MGDNFMKQAFVMNRFSSGDDVFLYILDSDFDAKKFIREGISHELNTYLLDGSISKVTSVILPSEEDYRTELYLKRVATACDYSMCWQLLNKASRANIKAEPEDGWNRWIVNLCRAPYNKVTEEKVFLCEKVKDTVSRKNEISFMIFDEIEDAEEYVRLAAETMKLRQGADSIFCNLSDDMKERVSWMTEVNSGIRTEWSILEDVYVK